MATPSTIDEYIAGFPAGVQKVLNAVRRTVHRAVPGLSEGIAYRIPALRLDGRPLVYFAGFSGHVGMYPFPRGDAALDRLLAPYGAGKGTLRFAHGEPLPRALIARVVKHMAAARARAAAKRSSDKAATSAKMRRSRKTTRHATARSARASRSATPTGGSHGAAGGRAARRTPQRRRAP